MIQRPFSVSTGSTVVDQITTVLLRTSMFVGCLSGFILDNTIPGKWHASIGKLSFKQIIVLLDRMKPNARVPIASFFLLTNHIRSFAVVPSSSWWALYMGGGGGGVNKLVFAGKMFCIIQ